MGEPLAEVLPRLDKALRRMTGEVDELSDSVNNLVSAIEGFDVEALKMRLEAISTEALRFSAT